jgi:DNA-binding NtrC family response regulator
MNSGGVSAYGSPMHLECVVAGDELCHTSAWASWLAPAGIPIACGQSTSEVLQRVTPFTKALVLGIRAASAQPWLSLIAKLRREYPELKVIVVAVESSEDLAVDSLRLGVNEYLRAPIAASELLAAVAAAVALVAKSPRSNLEHGLLGNSAAMQELRRKIERLAKVDSNVLITGDTGTGKELAALALHQNSKRKHYRFISINCASIPENLFESELYGYEKGAFTGAQAVREGKFKAADRGTLFLDEVGELPLFAQAKILRAVESGEVYRLGGHKAVTFDTRIIAATHRNLEEMVAAGTFRQDLYFRLNVGSVQLTPLRSRRDDLPLLILHYLRELSARLNTKAETFSEAAWQTLMQHSWPGNVRELKNALEAALVNADGPTIHVEDLPAHVQTTIEVTSSRGERDEMIDALLATKWNKSKAAERLHWSRMTLYRKLAKYAISAPARGEVA